MVDADLNEIGVYDLKLKSDSPRRLTRLQQLLRGHKCFEIFGLIRRDVLARTPVMGAYAHGDGVLLVRLAMFGRFEEIPEPLFVSRRHDDQSGVMENDGQSYAVWFDPKLGGRMIFPYWRIYWEFLRSIHMVPMGLDERLRSYRIWLRRAHQARRALRADISHNLRRLTAGRNGHGGA
jgi:hypothetical protein